MKKLLLVGALFAAAVSTTACVLIFRHVEVRNVDPKDEITVATSVKAHLKDGSIVTYPGGVKISGGVVRGEGFLYDLTLGQGKSIREIPVDDVVGMESFRTRVDAAESVTLSALATVGSVVGGVVLAVAIFGSCPTIYSNDGKTEEAELFSTSIAPLFEARDVGRLQAQPDANGRLRLEVRNEAMETHYINHLQLFEVAHTSGEFVLPDDRGNVVAVRDLQTPAMITDRNGRDIRSAIDAADDRFFETDPAVLDAAIAGDMSDWIDFTAPVPAGSSAATLVFRLRNSLLSTTLLYDVMLAPAGAHALDWLNHDLAKISTAVELGRWYQKRAGLHVSVWRDGEYHEVARIPDSGPISWHDVAASIPVLPGEKSLRVRLSFVADQWRIDRIAFAPAARQVKPRVIPIQEIRASDGHEEAEARLNMSAPDERYLQTSPGQRFFVDFSAGAGPEHASRTFLLSSQGYYTEWIRGTWIKTASSEVPFAPTDESLLAALKKWRARRGDFEKQFREARVPVR